MPTSEADISQASDWPPQYAAGVSHCGITGRLRPIDCQVTRDLFNRLAGEISMGAMLRLKVLPVMVAGRSERDRHRGHQCGAISKRIAAAVAYNERNLLHIPLSAIDRSYRDRIIT